ncbi:MAG TPA: hypothetical protein VMV44_14595 [Rectinemataceae bacterium]|nr:hypothetical protein [Rectinemataceae bacterium]
MQEQESLSDDIEKALSPQGLDLLEFQLSRRKDAVQVRVVVRAAGGTGTEECAKAHRLIAQRLAEVHGIVDPFIEVSSPGIDRSLKKPRDFAIFTGSKIRFIREGETEWERGLLLGIQGETLSIDTAEGRLAIPLAGLAKARLDSTTEGE